MGLFTFLSKEVQNQKEKLEHIYSCARTDEESKICHLISIGLNKSINNHNYEAWRNDAEYQKKALEFAKKQIAELLAKKSELVTQLRDANIELKNNEGIVKKNELIQQLKDANKKLKECGSSDDWFSLQDFQGKYYILNRNKIVGTILIIPNSDNRDNLVVISSTFGSENCSSYFAHMFVRVSETKATIKKMFNEFIIKTKS